MKALILSGGKGTRLQPITNSMAKQLVPVANKPVLFYALETVVAAGIFDIGIIVGDAHEEIKAAVKDGKEFGPEVSITYIQQEQPLGLAHAVKIAQPFLRGERFLMFLGDNFIEERIDELVQQFFAPSCPYSAQVFLKHVAHPEHFGVAQLCTLDGQAVPSEAVMRDDEVRIVRLVEKPKEVVSSYALVGMYFFDEHVFEAIEAIRPSPRGELEITDAIQSLLEQGFVVRPHFLAGSWIDTGRMEDMLAANCAVLSHMKGRISATAVIDQTSQVYGEVILEDEVCLSNSIVCGPSIIGRNVTLSGAFIGPWTSIAEDCVVVNSAIEQSIVLHGCSISDIEGRIQESLIGCHTQIYPAAARDGSYRLLLGDHSRIGIV